ncbi:MAG: rRNA pseudouridine synthase [Gammaproteobacteria bacterium]|nr:rRNA pseudouridine synthase [Gammaproteobacteria bacterium]
MSEPMRLSKRLIQLIGCSRSEADKYIEGGWVLVDGKAVDAPQFMVEEQKVELHPNATLDPVLPMTILLHSPVGFDTTDPTATRQLITPDTRVTDDNTSIRTLKRHFVGLMPTAPLQTGATGLLVFSQDKRVVQRLVKDAKKNEQEYTVEVSGEIEPDGLEQLNREVKRKGWPLPKAKVSWQSENKLRFALKNIQADQIEFMCQSVGLTVVSMVRIRIGSIPLAKLPPGQWRYLPVGKLF